MSFVYPLRVPAALAGAFLVTAALFLLMKSLIAFSDLEIETKPSPEIRWVKIPEMTELITKRPEAVPPPAPDVPPRPPKMAIAPTGRAIPIPTPAPNPARGPTRIAGGLSDGPTLPIVRVEPHYPRRAVTRGIEGYTIVEFDVYTDGSVRNARVIESDPTSIFDRASLDAVQRFRYKPKIVDGRPVVVTGVRNRFTYELD